MTPKRGKSKARQAEKQATTGDASDPRKQWSAIHAKYDELLRPFVGRPLQPGSPDHSTCLEIMSRRSGELEKFEQEHSTESLIGTPNDLLEAIEQARTTAEMIAVAEGEMLHRISDEVYARLYRSALALYGGGITTVEPPERKDDPENGLASLQRWCLIALRRGENGDSGRTRVESGTDDSNQWLTVTKVADFCDRTRSRIVQLCKENKIDYRGERRERRVNLLSARRYFAEVDRQRVSRENARLARDARLDARELKDDRRRTRL